LPSCLLPKVNHAAVSTTDYMALVCIMNDMRLKLLEDMAEQQRVRSVFMRAWA